METVLILYHSQQFGHTHAMAQGVAEGVRAAGAEPVLVNTNETRMNVDAYRAYKAVAFGSPDYFSYIAGGLKTFLDDWYIARGHDSSGLEGKPLGLFYSHGGGGAVRGPMENLFSRLGTPVGPTVESRGRPGAAALEACRALGRQLAQAALKK